MPDYLHLADAIFEAAWTRANADAGNGPIRTTKDFCDAARQMVPLAKNVENGAAPTEFARLAKYLLIAAPKLGFGTLVPVLRAIVAAPNKAWDNCKKLVWDINNAEPPTPQVAASRAAAQRISWRT